MNKEFVSITKWKQLYHVVPKKIFFGYLFFGVVIFLFILTPFVILFVNIVFMMFHKFYIAYYLGFVPFVMFAIYYSNKLLFEAYQNFLTKELFELSTLQIKTRNITQFIVLLLIILLEFLLF